MAEGGRQVFSALELGPGCLVLGIVGGPTLGWKVPKSFFVRPLGVVKQNAYLTFPEVLAGFSVREVVERAASVSWCESSVVASPSEELAGLSCPLVAWTAA